MADYESYLENVTESNFSTFECQMEQPIMASFTQILYSIVCITGLFGNTLVIYVVLRFSKMQTVTNIYIVNLAVADQCFLIGIPFLVITMNQNSWAFGNLMCKIYMSSTSINQFTSSIFLTIMSADRYIAICHPVSSPEIRTAFLSKMVSLAAWFVSIMLVFPVFLFSGTLEGNNITYCNIFWPESENSSGEYAFILYSFISGFGLPLLLISVFYSLVVKKLRSVRKMKKVQAHKRVTKLVLTIIAVYMFCWLPYWITQISLLFTPAHHCHSELTVTMFVLAGCLSYSNSAMNPILYAFLSDNFKKSFLKACFCANWKRNSITVTSDKSGLRKRSAGSNSSSLMRGKKLERYSLASCVTDTAL